MADAAARLEELEKRKAACDRAYSKYQQSVLETAEVPDSQFLNQARQSISTNSTTRLIRAREMEIEAAELEAGAQLDRQEEAAKAQEAQIELQRKLLKARAMREKAEVQQEVQSLNGSIALSHKSRNLTALDHIATPADVMSAANPVMPHTPCNVTQPRCNSNLVASMPLYKPPPLPER